MNFCKLKKPVVDLVVTQSLLAFIVFSLLYFVIDLFYANAYEQKLLNDQELTVQPVASGIRFPTGMAFLGPDDLLVLDKNNGTVNRWINGSWTEPLLDANVSNSAERGMLGIAVMKDVPQNKTYVFLYYTESSDGDGSDKCSYVSCPPGHDPLGNRLYRYELQGNKLTNPKLLLDLPATPGPVHNGGKLKVGPDNNLYLIIGDLHPTTNVTKRTSAQNYNFGDLADGRAGILRITPDGQTVGGKGILGDTFPLNKYYGYGIRNGFGLAFDPETGNLWDTENGPLMADEINLVKPGFNGGWNKIQGLWKPIYDINNMTTQTVNSSELLLQNFSGRGHYSSPQFTFKNVVAPTALVFLNSSALGDKYKDDLFVGTVNEGYIFDFDLTHNRSKLLLDGPLEDMVSDSPDELQDNIFAHVIGGVTDLVVGPDGYLYYASPGGIGGIYKIMPKKLLPDARSISLNQSSIRLLGSKITLNNSALGQPVKLNQTIDYIETSLKINSVSSSLDNHADLYWFDGNGNYHSILVKDNILSYFMAGHGEQSLGRIDPQEIRKWYTLKIVFANDSLNVFLNDVLSFHTPYEYSKYGISKVGRSTLNLSAQFEPIKVAQITKQEGIK